MESPPTCTCSFTPESSMNHPTAPPTAAELPSPAQAEAREA